MHLIGEGNILSYYNCKIQFNLECSCKQYSLVVKAIPVVLRNLIKGILQYFSVIPTFVDLLIDSYNLLDDKCN